MAGSSLHPLAASSRLGSYLSGAAPFGSALNVAAPPPCPVRLLAAGLVPPYWNEALFCWGIQGPTGAWGAGLDQHAWHCARLG